MLQIIDSIMGSGKTTTLFNKIHDGEIKEPILYVSPLLSEIEQRIHLPSSQGGLGEFQFKNPKAGWNESKSDHIVKLIDEGHNIACTHELLKRLTPESVIEMKKKGYTVIIDEAVQAYDLIPVDTRKANYAPDSVNPDDIKMMMEAGYLVVNPETRQVFWGPGKGDYKGRYEFLRNYILMGKVFMTEAFEMLVWEYPADIFKYIENVVVMTYLFEGSMMQAYLNINNIPYSMIEPEAWGLTSEAEIKDAIKRDLVIYDGKHNDLGRTRMKTRLKDKNQPKGPKVKVSVAVENDTTLCVNSLMTKSTDESQSKPTAKAKELLKAVRNVVNTAWKLKGEEVIYTTSKRLNNKAKPVKLASRYVPCNTKATNDYSHIKGVAYGLNLYMNVDLVRFIRGQGGLVNEDVFALSEMIQFIWRGRIRNVMNPDVESRMDVYIPSARMRKLLTDWLGMDEVK